MTKRDKFNSLESQLAASVICYDKEEMDDFFEAFDQINQDGNFVIDGMFIQLVSFLRKVDLNIKDPKKRKKKLIEQIRIRAETSITSSNERESFLLWFDNVCEKNLPMDLAEDIFYKFIWEEFKKSVESLDKSEIDYKNKIESAKPKIPKALSKGGIIKLGEVQRKTEGESYSTSFKELDAFVKPKCGNFLVIAARPGVGKSQIMLNMAMDNALKGVRCLYISLEMTPDEIKTRIINHISKTDLKEQHSINGILNEESYIEACSKVENSKVYRTIDENIDLYQVATSNADSILTKVEEMIKENKYKIVFIDYLQLVRYPHLDEYKSLSMLTRSLKTLALGTNTLVVTGSQVSRASTETGISLAALFGSSTIEADTDIVIGLENPNDRRQGSMANLNVKIMKNRQGSHETLKYSIDYSCGVTEQNN